MSVDVEERRETRKAPIASVASSASAPAPVQIQLDMEVGRAVIAACPAEEPQALSACWTTCGSLVPPDLTDPTRISEPYEDGSNKPFGGQQSGVGFGSRLVKPQKPA